jgi:cytidylate kinase
MTSSRTRTRGLVIAIDGPAGAGKSSVTRSVARRLGMARLDTGSMYRALTWEALRRGIDPSDGKALAHLARTLRLSFRKSGVAIGGRVREREIRSRRVNAAVSQVSSHRAVRRVMVSRQRALARAGNVVVEGRDIGTVVVPGADLRIFLTASATERARRRHREMVSGGSQVDLKTLAAEIRARDAIDSVTTPLVPAPDAVVLDSTGKPLEMVVSEIVRRARGLGSVAVGPRTRPAARPSRGTGVRVGRPAGRSTQ